jgi:hypothetical protein
MGRTLRLFEGRFGRLVLGEVAADERIEAGADPIVVLQQRYDGVLFLNPGEVHVSPGPTRLLVFHAASEWLRSGFPAVFTAEDPRPFTVGVEAITPRIRQLADTMAIEVLNDRFLSTERLEFMLQELLLSIVETYLARRRASSPLWRGSRFEDTRIRRAIALLRAHPNKEPREPGRPVALALLRSFSDLHRLLAARLSRHALRRDRHFPAFLRARQDRRGGRRARLFRPEQLHALLPEPGRRAALGIPPRREHAARRIGKRPRTARPVDGRSPVRLRDALPSRRPDS